MKDTVKLNRVQLYTEQMYEPELYKDFLLSLHI